MATIVVFSSQGARIYEGANPADYSGRADVLIDPVFPPRTPPHLWQLQDGKIVVGNSHIPTLSSVRKIQWSIVSAYLLGALTATAIIGILTLKH